MTTPSKRLALFLDGTWNSSDDNTNVWRLRSLVAERGNDGVPQRAYYDVGVGTAFGSMVGGGALGWGLDDNVIEAYRWLIEQYNEGDEVFLFGFSRGAYTARSVAGLIAKCGLLRPGAAFGIRQVYKRYQLDQQARPIYTIKYEQERGRSITPEEKRLLENSRRIPIKMIGVWDTVGSLGIPFGNIRGLSRGRLGFHNTRLSNLYGHAYQALAIDEHREAFQPTIWTKFTPLVPDPESDKPKPEPVVEQRWFIGAHANVGGGYVNDDLPQIPLCWMAGKAEALGLCFRYPMILSGEEDRGAVADSFASFLHGAYKLLKGGRAFHRTIGAPPIRKANGIVRTVNETVDASVFRKWNADSLYRPPSLANWIQSRGIDPARITDTVGAVDGRVWPVEDMADGV